MCAGALSAGAQREAVLRPLSLPIPLQVHMCFISRPAHRTVNSNGGLAWGYSQPPGRDGKTAGKKMTSMGEIIPPVFTFSRLFFFFSVSLSLSSLSFAVLAPCSVFALRFVFVFFLCLSHFCSYIVCFQVSGQILSGSRSICFSFGLFDSHIWSFPRPFPASSSPSSL